MLKKYSKKKEVFRRVRPKKIERGMLLDELTYNSYRFSFTKAIDIVMLLEGNDIQNITNENVSLLCLKSAITFQSKYSDVFNIEGIKDQAPEVTVNMNGISGIEGTIPDPYDEEYVLYNRESKQAVMDFYNMFNSRMLSLKYMFLKRHVVECLSNPIDRSLVGNIISSLSGFGFNNDTENREAFDTSFIPQQFKISSQNIFWRTIRSAELLKIMISSYFDVDTSIDQFTGGFSKKVAEAETTRIGIWNQNLNALGKETILGEKIWDTTHGITIHISSLNIKRYTEFLPKISRKDNKISPLQKMKEIIKMYVPFGIETKIVFHLDEKNVAETILSGIKRLNKDAFIMGPHSEKDTCFVEHVRNK